MKSITDIFRSYGITDMDGRHINGTDKQTNHNYGDAYRRIIDDNFASSFDHLYGKSGRWAVKLMMEIGVADGSSLLAWSEVFPNAHCVGMDIHHADKAYGDRIEFHCGDQRSKGDCDRIAAGRQFDFICEDATHLLEDSLRTLLYMWPYIRPGGIYVVEEFANIGALRDIVTDLFPCARIIDTIGPFGGVEPLVIFKKK